MRWKAIYNLQELLCGKHWKDLTKICGLNSCFQMRCDCLRVNWVTPPVSRTPHDACRQWQIQARGTVRLCSKVMLITASCCTFCEVTCFDMCYNKSRVILNVYKKRLIICFNFVFLPPLWLLQLTSVGYFVHIICRYRDQCVPPLIWVNLYYNLP